MSTIEEQDNKDIEMAMIEIVNNHNGMKATELAVEIIEKLAKEGNIPSFDFVDVLENIVNKGLLVEVEYTIPSMDWRIKSFLLPAGSSVQVNNAEEFHN